MFIKVAGLAAFVWASGQAGGQAAAGHGIDVGVASIVCAAIAGIVAVAVALIGRPRSDPHDSLDDEVKLALIASLVAIRTHEAERDGDDVAAEEQQLLSRHLSAELERRTRGKK